MGLIGNMVEAFKTLRETQIRLGTKDPAEKMSHAFTKGGGVASMRQGLSGVLGGVTALGIASAEQMRVIGAIMGAVTVTYASMMIFQAVKALANAKLIFEATQAAIETAAHVASVVGIPFVALAAVTAAGVYAGLQVSSGSWTIPSGATDIERRQAISRRG